MVVLLVASAVAQVVWAQHDVNHAYYGTDARVYQLLAGVAAALVRRHLDGRGAVPARVVALAPAVTVAGLAALLVAAADVGLDPSQRGLVATAASVALVLGVVLAGEQLTARALGRPTMTYLGRISYGTYLWHWPVVLVLLEVFDAGAWTVFVLTSVLATGIAALSFHVLEHPIRTSRALAPYPTVLVGVTASAVLALVVIPPVLESERRPVVAAPAGGTLESTDENVDQQVPTDIDYAAYLKDRGGGNTYCTAADTTSCVVHEGTSGLHVALVGDSHARMMAPTLEQLAEEHDFTLSLAVVTACSWQRGVENIRLTSREKDRCRSSRDDFYDQLIEDMDVDVVLLSQIQRDDDTWYADLQPVGGEQQDPEPGRARPAQPDHDRGHRGLDHRHRRADGDLREHHHGARRAGRPARVPLGGRAGQRVPGPGAVALPAVRLVLRDARDRRARRRDRHVQRRDVPGGTRVRATPGRAAGVARLVALRAGRDRHAPPGDLGAADGVRVLRLRLGGQEYTCGARVPMSRRLR